MRYDVETTLMGGKPQSIMGITLDELLDLVRTKLLEDVDKIEYAFRYMEGKADPTMYAAVDQRFELSLTRVEA